MNIEVTESKKYVKDFLKEEKNIVKMNQRKIMLKQKKRQQSLIDMNKPRSSVQVVPDEKTGKKLDSTNEPKHLVKHLLDLIATLQDQLPR